MGKPKPPPPSNGTWLRNALRQDWERSWINIINREVAMAKAKKGKGKGGKKGC